MHDGAGSVPEFTVYSSNDILHSAGTVQNLTDFLVSLAVRLDLVDELHRV
mgnify:CR=1 FL=1